MKLVVSPRKMSSPAPLPPESANLLVWLPYLWRRVLFPGRAEAAEGVRWRSLILLAAVASLAVFPALNFALFEPDEGRYAQIPREMLARGDWLVPRLQGEAYLDKPPLLYWLVMIAYRAFGPAAWVARLVPALAIVGCVLSVYAFGRRTLGERSAFWGALLLALVPGMVSMGRILVLDGLLTLFVSIALLTGLEAACSLRFNRFAWRLMALALALGTLTKGPIAVLLVLPPLIAYRWLNGPSPRIGWRAWGELFGIVAAVNLPWYVAISLRHPEFASYFLWKHNLQRFLTPFDHDRPVWFFAPVLLIGLAPLVWLLPLAVRFLFAGLPETAARRSPEIGYFLLAGCWCLGFFSLSGSKLPTYILPAFPPLCLALGAYVVASGWSQSRWLWGSLVIWGAALFVGHMWIVPTAAWERSPMNHPAEATAYLQDRAVPIYCYPRSIDSPAFYLGRDDFQVYRSKELASMLQSIDKHPRSVILFAHRNSKQILTHHLPPHFRVVYVGKLGLCDLAVIER